MKRRISASAFLLLSALASSAVGQQAQITIDKIEPDSYISGLVHGVVADDAKDYKIVVYVHTDRWYMHPYASGGEGMSWASLNPDGTWKLPTVKREFPANSVAALLMPRDQSAPNLVSELDSIRPVAKAVKDLIRTEDAGKL